ncbi:TadE/TadG family type IV pilus assembly protein [uncultured Brevundimonas sp.]|uniref:TadE/TadG family type IV pilus assembly protein n=1 Tax=uncultured Brevundimonas sp. TaxID=213418 RepID=UPI002634BB1E|nr:TadE/TadG family type IV pilus assembly protein [uncultured Brevundimonas sp.]
MLEQPKTRCARASGKGRAGKRRVREGATAVEFALVAFPFFVLMLAIFEVASILTVSSLLESAVMNSGRLVRTGQIPANATKEDFIKEVCGRMTVFEGACLQRLQLDLQPVASFSNPGINDPIKDGVFDPNDTKFNIGAPRSFMLMRVWYRQPIVSPLLGHAMTRLNNGDTLLHASTAFRNEPYA